MRTYVLTLTQNLGDGSLGSVLDLSSKISELGSLRWEVDERLTKLSPGDFSPVILDYDGSVWNWIQAQAPSAGALFPPFLALDIDGKRAFTGIVQPSAATRDVKTGVVHLQAQDWSVMLASAALDEWVRPLPIGTLHPRPQTDFTCSIVQGDFGGPKHDFARGTTWGPSPFIEGDLVTLARLPGRTFRADRVLNYVTAFEGNNYESYEVRLLGLWQAWKDTVHPTEAWNFPVTTGQWWDTYTRQAQPRGPQNWYVVQKTIGHDTENPCHAINLDTVDGLVPGDELTRVGTSDADKWTILQVDAAGLQVITREEVRDVAKGSNIFFSPDCAKELVFADARSVLTQAVCGLQHNLYGIDLSRYTPPTLPVPVMIWLPLRPLTGADLTSIKDMDQGFSNLRVFGSGATTWDGTPEAGWQTAAGTLPRAHWTNQTLVAPSSLMPDETTTIQPTAAMPLSPATPRRYRPTTMAFRARQKDDEDVSKGTDPGAWNPTTIPAVVLYDYLAMRRIQIAGTAVTVNAWTGAAWAANVNVVWPVGSTVKSACVLPGGPAGMVVGLTSAGLVGAVLPGLSLQTGSTAIPASAVDAVLASTPWGAYLVGSRGYGRITYAAGVLALAWVDLIVAGGGTLYPGTFAGIDATHVMVCARFDTLDSSGKTVTETHLLLLQPVPSTSQASLVWDEKILDGAPITLGAMRDPSQVGRAVGHCGGRIFQVSSTLPVAYALERFTPSKMNSAELLEHVCQILQAVAVPRPDGVMQIVSRSSIAAPVALAVDQVDITDTRAWEHFYSLVRVTGATDGLLYDATGPVTGGKLLEISQHPLIWSLSGCAAMGESFAAWFGVPRRLQTQSWFWTDTNTAAPWESLLALTRLNINGEAVTRMITSLEYRPDQGTATATLVEV